MLEELRRMMKMIPRRRSLSMVVVESEHGDINPAGSRWPRRMPGPDTRSKHHDVLLRLVISTLLAGIALLKEFGKSDSGTSSLCMPDEKNCTRAGTRRCAGESFHRGAEFDADHLLRLSPSTSLVVSQGRPNTRPRGASRVNVQSTRTPIITFSITSSFVGSALDGDRDIQKVTENWRRMDGSS